MAKGTATAAGDEQQREAALLADAAAMGVSFSAVHPSQPFREVHGVDLARAPLGDAATLDSQPPTPLAALLRRAFVHFGLLVFRGQELEPEDEVRVNRALRYHDTGQNEFAFGFGKAVGATTGMQSSAVLPSHPEVVVMGSAELTDHYGIEKVSLQQALGYKTPGFHHDGLHEDGPHIPGGLATPIVTSMLCHAAPDESAVPPGGEANGATLFTSTVRALEWMDPGLRRELDGAVVYYENQRAASAYQSQAQGPPRDMEALGPMEMVDGFRKRYANEDSLRASLDAEEFEEVYFGGLEPAEGGAVHPLIRTVWERGEPYRQAVYCSAFGVNHIRAKGGRVYGVRESWELVQRVLERPCEVGVRYAHQWRVGDFVIWGPHRIAPPPLSPLAWC